MKILVVDDDPRMLALTSAVLASGGYDVTEASTGKDALDMVAKTRPDLVVLDVVLPDISGFEACKEIKSDPVLRSTFVVLHSGLSTSSEAQTTGLDIGADGYIVKGIPTSELLARVNALVRIKKAEDALQRANDELDQRVKARTAELLGANQRLVASEKSLLERLRFETLLAEISARFVSLPAGRIYNEIEDVQRRVCELFGLDRSTLWQFPETDPEIWFLLTHRYEGSEMQVPTGLHARDLFPWAAQKVLSGETLAVSTMDDLPPEAARDRDSWRQYGTKSTLVIPLLAGGGTVLGVVSFAQVRRERDWPETVVKYLQLIAQVFANALSRKRADQGLREGEARYRLLAENVKDVIWTMDMDGHFTYVSPSVVNLRGFTAREVMRQTIDEALAPDSARRAKEALEHLRATGGMDVSIQNLELEMPRKDGSTIWMEVSTNILRDAEGKPVGVLGVSRDISERRRMDTELRKRLDEIERLKQQLEHENIYLQKEVKLLGEHDIIGQSTAMKTVLAQAEQVAKTGSTVLILGETGTGKELLAREIHNMSVRTNRPLVTVNCASLPPTLMESELFGREKGAYTGAMTRMAGRFEIADGSTLFLDEIGEVPLELQAKLLRVLEEGVFERLGSTRSIRVNVRLIAATNKDLAEQVKEGKFRKDLYYRLNVFPIRIPPLRERPDDIPLMVWAFVSQFQEKMGKRIDSIAKKSMEALQSYPWPGNVRELRNVIERAMILSRAETLEVTLPRITNADRSPDQNLEEVERGHILSVLEKTSWRVTGKDSAAEILGLKRSTLQSRMKKLAIKRPTR